MPTSRVATTSTPTVHTASKRQPAESRPAQHSSVARSQGFKSVGHLTVVEARAARVVRVALVVDVVDVREELYRIEACRGCGEAQLLVVTIADAKSVVRVLVLRKGDGHAEIEPDTAAGGEDQPHPMMLVTERVCFMQDLDPCGSWLRWIGIGVPDPRNQWRLVHVVCAVSILLIEGAFGGLAERLQSRLDYRAVMQEPVRGHVEGKVTSRGKRTIDRFVVLAPCVSLQFGP